MVKGYGNVLCGLDVKADGNVRYVHIAEQFKVARPVQFRLGKSSTHEVNLSGL